MKDVQPISMRQIENPERIPGANPMPVIGDVDWAATPLGAAEQWAPALAWNARYILASSQPMFLWWGPDFVHLHNAAFSEAFGAHEAPGAGSSAASAWPEFWRAAGSLAKQVVDRGAGVAEEAIVLASGGDGQLKADVTFNPVFDENGVAGIIGVAAFLPASSTAAGSTDAATAESRAQLLLITDALPALVAYVDAGQRYQFNNKAYETWFGQTPDEIKGKTLAEVVGQDAHEALRVHIEAALSGRRVKFEAKVPYADGGTRDVEADYIPHVSPDGKVEGFFALIHDISERKRREREFAYAFDAAEMATWDCDHVTGRFHEPARLNQLYGYPAGFPLDAAAVQALHHPDDKERLQELRERQVGDRTVTEVEREFRILRPDGVTRWIFARGEIIRGPGGEALRSIGVAMDITRLKETEQALRERTGQLEAVLETAPAGVWFTYDVQVAHAPGNRQAAAMFRTGEYANLSLGAPEDERPPLVICRGGKVLAENELPLQRAARGEQVIEEELEFRYPDGGSMTVLLRASTLRDGDGKPAGAVAAAVDISSRKQAEEALRASEERLRHIFDSAKEYAIITLDPAGRITGWNRGAERILGYSEDEVVGRSGEIFFSPEDRAADAPELEMALARAEGRATNERWHMRKDGSRFWGSGVMLPLADGAATGFLKMFRDRTTEREAEEALAEASERARALAAERAAVLGQLAEGVIVTDTAGRITFVNEAARHIHGGAELDVPPEEYAEAFHLFTEDGRPYPSEELPLARAVLHGDTVTDARWRILRPDGVEVLAVGNASPVRGEDGGVIGNVLTLRDDTAREAGERGLREADIRKNIALGAGKMGVWDWDIAADKLVWDDAECVLYGVDPGTFVPTNERFENFIHPADLGPFRQAAQTAIDTGAPLDTEFRIIRGDGQERWISERAVVLPDAAGEAVRMIGVSFDITDRRKADERRNLLINELNHRVKNTLATVQSIASQTLKNSDVGSTVREAFESRLISLSKAHDVLTRQNWEGARLGEIAVQSLQPFEGAAPRIAISGPDVRLSPKAALALSMAFHELATNAVKYGALSREQGKVRVEWKVEAALLRIHWQESDGPPVEAPRRKGFGSRLIERSLAGELGGAVRMEYLRAGVVCRIEAPLAGFTGSIAGIE